MRRHTLAKGDNHVEMITVTLSLYLTDQHDEAPRYLSAGLHAIVQTQRKQTALSIVNCPLSIIHCQLYIILRAIGANDHLLQSSFQTL